LTTHTKIIPCTVTFMYNPEEPATEFEPKVEEEFEVISAKFGNEEIIHLIDENCYGMLDVAIEKYLMENADE